jgi:hypothetical protein
MNKIEMQGEEVNGLTVGQVTRVIQAKDMVNNAL